MRCPNCGARNPAEATWCTQCYARFEEATAVEPSPPEPPAPDGVTEIEATLEPGVVSAEDDGAPGAGPVEVGDVRQIDGVIEWRCGTCASWVALESELCAVCGAPRSGFGEAPRSEVPVGELDRGKVLGAAAIFPGVGHLLAGRTGSGLTRLLLGALWLLGGIWWLATTSTVGTAPGVILIVGTLVLWVASYLDVQALLAGRDEPFGLRGLLWSVVGVTALLMVTVAWLATGSSIATLVPPWPR